MFLAERKREEKKGEKEKSMKKIKKQISFYAKEIKLRMFIFLTYL